MNILVCVKAVPMDTEIRLSENRNLDRESAGLNLNISDSSAVEAALRLKGSDGRICALSMGTRSAEYVLADLFTRGVDEAFLLSDRKLSGSDTFATAKALSKAVTYLEEKMDICFDLILCGRRAMDGETAQIPGELAARLGRTCISSVRDISLLEEGKISCIRMLDDREKTVLAGMPCVVSVAEYSYRLRLPGIMGKRAARLKQVQYINTGDLGLSEEECGLSGSLTKVISNHEIQHGLRKGPRVTDVQKGIRESAALILESLKGTSGSVGKETVPQYKKDCAEDKGEILVLCPENGDWGLLSRAAAMARETEESFHVRAVVFSSEDEKKAFLYGADLADRIILSESFCDDNLLAEKLAEMVKCRWNSRVILAPALATMRNIMPMMAVHLKAGLTADCTEISLQNDGKLIQVRPAFGNHIMAEIATLSEIQMATVRKGIYPEQKYAVGPDRQAAVWDLRQACLNDRVELVCESAEETNGLYEAELIFSGGTGIGNKEDFREFSALADKAGAMTAASRAAVDKGLIPYSHQVGQTGIAVRPKVYVAVGISGAVQHLAGMLGSKTVVAINTDPKAQIMNYADYGIIGDWKEILPGIVELITLNNRKAQEQIQ